MNTKFQNALGNYADLLLDAVCIVDVEGRYLYTSAAFQRIFGYAPSEVLGRKMIELVHPDDRKRTLDAANEIMAGSPAFNFENRYIRKDGRVVNILWSAQWSEPDQIRVAVARDITERKRAEALQSAIYAISEAAHSTEDLPALYASMHNIIGELIPAQNFCVVMEDETTGEITLPYNTDERQEPFTDHLPAFNLLYQEVKRTGSPLLISSKRTALEHPDLDLLLNSTAACWLAAPLKVHKGIIGALILKNYENDCHYSKTDEELLSYVATQVVTAIERKQMQGRLRYMAEYDELTTLPNRALLHDRLEQALARTRRQGGRLAILYLDLDHFKQINDQLGHGAGDVLLQTVAERLKNTVRESDTIGRIGGDEFVVILEDIDRPHSVDLVADKIRVAIFQPVMLAGISVQIMPSIGSAIFPDNGETVRDLINHADERMYELKRRAGSFRLEDEVNPENAAETHSLSRAEVTNCIEQEKSFPFLRNAAPQGISGACDPRRIHLADGS